MGAKGFFLSAVPTALDAFGFPIYYATNLYVDIFPLGISFTAS